MSAVGRASVPASIPDAPECADGAALLDLQHRVAFAVGYIDGVLSHKQRAVIGDMLLDIRYELTRTTP